MAAVIRCWVEMCLCCCGFQFTVLTYILNLAWMGVTSLLATTILIYFMLNSICIHEYVGKAPWDLTYENCLNLSRFGKSLR